MNRVIRRLVAILALPLTLTAHGTVANSATQIPARFGQSAVYDPGRDRLLVYGGNDGFDLLLGDCWALTLSGSPDWTPVQPTGEVPRPRAFHSAIYDAYRDRMIVIGGTGDGGLLDEVWSLALSGPPTWTRLSPTGTGPGARSFASAVYDARLDRIVLFGGLDEAGPTHDVWSLTLGPVPAWVPIAVSGPAPAERYLQSAIYDIRRDRIVVFGGCDFRRDQNDVWTLTIAAGAGTWTELSPAGTPPSRRNGQSAIYDPVGDRMLIFGGWNRVVGFQCDVWALSLAGDPAWTPLANHGGTPAGRTVHSAVLDPMRLRMLVFGGTGSGETRSFDDSWGLSLGAAPTWAALVPRLESPPSPPAIALLLPPNPNPAHGRVAVRWSIARAGTVRLGVYDPAGRLVRELVHAERPAGADEAAWDGRRASGESAEPGVYFVRLAAPGFVQSRRVVLM